MNPLLLKLGLYGCLDKMPNVLEPEEGTEGPSSLTDEDPGEIPVADDTPPNRNPKITNLKIHSVTGKDACFEEGNFFKTTFMVNDPDDHRVECSVELYTHAVSPPDLLKTVEIPFASNGERMASFRAELMSPSSGGRDFYIEANCFDERGATAAPQDEDFTTPLAEGCEDSDGDGFVNTRDNCRAVSNGRQLDTDLDGTGNACDHRPVISGRRPSGGVHLLPSGPHGWDANSHIPFSFDVSDQDKDLKSCTITHENMRTNDSTAESVLDFSEPPFIGDSYSVEQFYPATHFQPITDYCWSVSCEDRAGNRSEEDLAGNISEEDRAGNISEEGGRSCFTTLDFGLVLWLRFKDRDPLNFGHDSSGLGNDAKVEVRVADPRPDHQLHWTNGGEFREITGKLNNGGIVIPFAGNGDLNQKIAGGSIHVPHSHTLNPVQSFSALIRFLSSDDINGGGFFAGAGNAWNFKTEPVLGRGKPVCTVDSDRGWAQVILLPQIKNDILYNALCVYGENKVRVQTASSQKEANISGNLPIPEDPKIQIGMNRQDSPLVDIPLLGIVDEVLFYNRAISEGEGNRLFCNLDHKIGCQ